MTGDQAILVKFAKRHIQLAVHNLERGFRTLSLSRPEDQEVERKLAEALKALYAAYNALPKAS